MNKKLIVMCILLSTIFICSVVLAAPPIELTSGVAPGTKLLVTKDAVRLRDIDDSSNVIATLNADAQVELVQYGSPYARVISSDNIEGLVSVEFLVVKPKDVIASATPTATLSVSHSVSPQSSHPNVTLSPQPTQTDNQSVTNPIDNIVDSGLSGRLKKIPVWIYGEVALSLLILIIIGIRRKRK